MSRVHEYAKHAGVPVNEVQEVLKDVHGLERLPHSNATVQDEWMETLGSKFPISSDAPVATPDIGSGLQNVESHPEEIAGLNEGLLERIAGLEERLAGRDEEVDRLNAEKVDAEAERQEMKIRVATLQDLSVGGKTYIPSSGKSVTANRGDLIGYIPTKQADPGQSFSGGWVVVKEDQQASPYMPVVGVVDETFSYDPATGAPMHSTRYHAYKRWLKRGRKNISRQGEPGCYVVGEREPKPINEPRSRLLVGQMQQ